MFDKFYLSFQIFKPIAALVFSVAYYAFLEFMEKTENQTIIDLPNEVLLAVESK